MSCNLTETLVFVHVRLSMWTLSYSVLRQGKHMSWFIQHCPYFCVLYL